MLPIFTLFKSIILKTISCFFTSEFVFSRNTLRRGNKDPKYISRAGQRTPASVAPGPSAIRRQCSSLTRDSIPAFCPGAARVLLSWFTLHTAERQSNTRLTPWAHLGSAKPSWAPAWPSKLGSLWLKKKGKKLSV